MRAMVLAGVVALAGCATGGDGMTTVPAITPPPVADSTAPATGAATRPTTRPTIGSSPPTSGTSTTGRGPTDEEAAVIAAFDASRLAYVECLVEPATCPYAVVGLAGSDADAQMRERVDVVVAGNLRVLPGSGPYERTIESVAIDGDSAWVRSCLTDGLVVVDVVDAADPADDIVFDDSTSSYRVRWTFTRTADGWRRTAAETLSAFPGMTSCDG